MTLNKAPNLVKVGGYGGLIRESAAGATLFTNFYYLCALIHHHHSSFINEYQAGKS